MDGLSATAEKALLDALLGATSFTATTPLFLAALTTMPTDRSGAGLAEPAAAGSYARVSVANTSANWSAATGSTSGSKTNAATISFPQASGSWGTIVGVGLSKVSTVGDNTAANWVAFATLTASQTISSGDTLSFATGNLTITMT